MPYSFYEPLILYGSCWLYSNSYIINTANTGAVRTKLFYNSVAAPQRTEETVEDVVIDICWIFVCAAHIYTVTPPPHPPPASISWYSHKVNWLFWALFSPTMILHIIPNCKQDPIYVLPDMKLCGLVPDFHINPSQIHECRSWERGRAVSFLEIFVSNFRYSAINFQVYLKTIFGPKLNTRISVLLYKRSTSMSAKDF